MCLKSRRFFCAVVMRKQRTYCSAGVRVGKSSGDASAKSKTLMVRLDLLDCKSAFKPAFKPNTFG